MKFHRSIWDFKERVIKIILTRKLWKNFTARSVPTENDKGRASARGKGEKGMNNQIYSYLFISKSKDDFGTQISMHNTQIHWFMFYNFFLFVHVVRTLGKKYFINSSFEV